MATVFISYRRDDCAAHAGRLCDRLARSLGQESVFMDVDAIEPGIDFSARIAEAIGACLVVIVLIGDDWLDITDSGGRRRLDDPADLVRHEVATALRRDGIRVIPVLVENAQMPPANRLPDELKALTSRNALELSDAGWRYDVERLIKVVERVVGVPAGSPELTPPESAPPQGRPAPAPAAAGAGGSNRSSDGTSLARSPLALAGGALALVLALVVAALALTRDDKPKTIGRSTEDTTPTQTQPPAAPRIVLGTRPNSIASANGALWVMSNAVPDLVVLDLKTGEERTRVPIGIGGSAVTAGFGSVWALNGRQRSLTRLTRTGAVSDSATPIRVRGKPVAIVAGAGALWVGVRREGAAVGTLVRLDPNNPTLQQPIAIRGGVQDIAFGKGAVWVTTTSGNNVVRVDAKNTARMQEIPVGGRPTGVAVGQGAVWVANSRDETISRIDPSARTAEVWVRLSYRPTRVATGGGSVWSTAQETDHLVRIDPDRPNKTEQYDTDDQPFALDVVDRNNVWVTLLNDRGVQRVRFDPR